MPRIELEMDRPLKNGQLTLDDGQTIQLTGGEGNKYHGTVHMEKDGAYHVAAIDEGQPVRLSEDYFIATDKAQPPEISHRPAARRLPRQPHRRSHGGREGRGPVRIERCASALLGQRRPGARDQPARQAGREERRRLAHAAARRFQARARRCGQRLCQRARWPRRSAHRYFLHPGGTVRARILAIAAERRGRRRWTAEAGTTRPKFPSARRN